MLPLELQRHIMMESDIDEIQSFCMTNKFTICHDFNFWHEKFEYDDILFMGNLPTTPIEWIKEYKKVYHCKALTYLLSQVNSVYIYLPKNTPQAIYDKLGDVCIEMNFKARDYNIKIEFNMNGYINVTIDTPLLMIFTHQHNISQYVMGSNMLLGIFNILYHIPELEITDKNKIPYTNLKRNLLKYDKHILTKRYNIYNDALNDFKKHPEILHEFTRELYSEIHNNRIKEYY